MKNMRWHILRVTLFSFLVFSWAQQSEALDFPTDSLLTDTIEKGIGPLVDEYVFDTTLIPFHDIYEHAWDSLNLDVPSFNPAEMNDTVNLPLILDESCGYTHPKYGEINSDFGWRRYRMHYGVDIDLETGDSVVAAFDGVVRIAKYNYGGFGNYVVIRHYNGLETLYGHLSERLVMPNQSVKAGELIGWGGSTGRSSGPHLHFEVRWKGKPINPNSVIDFQKGYLLTDTIDLCKNHFTYKTPYGSYNSGGRMYHRIRRGDSLWKISRSYGVSVNQLCRLNGISKNTTLRIGRTLRVK